MERKAAQSISLAEEDAEINPVLPGAGGGTHEPEMDRLSNIITEFSKTWGGKFSDREPVGEVISRIPDQVLEDQNARKNSGRQNAQVKLDSAHRRLVTRMVRRQTELYRRNSTDGTLQDGTLQTELYRRNSTDGTLQTELYRRNSTDGTLQGENCETPEGGFEVMNPY